MAYKLTVSGVVSFKDEDEAIRLLLLGEPTRPEAIEVAIDELEEEASDVRVEMIEIK